MSEDEWNLSNVRALGVRFSGEGLEECDEQCREIQDDDFFLVLNAHYEEIEFVLPSFRPETVWRTIFDTSRRMLRKRDQLHDCGTRIAVRARSLVLLKQEPAVSEEQSESNRHAMPFGAEVMDDGRVRFRLWAPACESVDLCIGEPI